MRTAVAPASKRPLLLAKISMICAPEVISDRRATRINYRARPPSPPFKQDHTLRKCFTICAGRYHFLSASPSDLRCQAPCLFADARGVQFRPRALSRLASGTSKLPYQAFKLSSDASSITCLCAKSADFAPASASCCAPIIHCSANRNWFITRSFHRMGPNDI